MTGHHPPQAVPADAGLLHGLPPLFNGQIRVLILGSFPGVASLQAGQYYAHPRNQFWPLLAALWPEHPQPSDYAGRCAWLLERGVGLWDVYASCQRQGSLDSAIENARLNDLPALVAQCPQLRLIAHNGGESHRHARLTRGLATQTLRLPSSSPANASWSFARKQQAWQQAMQRAGLLESGQTQCPGATETPHFPIPPLPPRS